MTRLDRIVRDVAAGETLTEWEVAALVRLAVATCAFVADHWSEQAYRNATAEQRAALYALTQEETT